MIEKKTGQAERLFEAMSGVDPELLARSEKKKKVISFQKYAKAMKVMAACLALIVVGGTCWVTLQNGGSQSAAESAAPNALKTVGEKGYASNSAQGDSAKAAETTMEVARQDDAMACDNEASSYYEADGTPMEAASEMEALNNDKKEISTGIKSDSTISGAQEEYFLKITKQVDSSKLNLQYSGKASIEIPGKRSGQSVPKSLSTAIYSWLDGLELIPSEDMTFGDYVCVQLIDEDGNVAKEIRVSGLYLQKTDLEGTFEIVDEEYNYDELRGALEAAMQAEE